MCNIVSPPALLSWSLITAEPATTIFTIILVVFVMYVGNQAYSHSFAYVLSHTKRRQLRIAFLLGFVCLAVGLIINMDVEPIFDTAVLQWHIAMILYVISHCSASHAAISTLNNGLAQENSIHTMLTVTQIVFFAGGLLLGGISLIYDSKHRPQ